MATATPTATIPTYRWSFYPAIDKPGATLGILVRDGVLLARIVVSREPAIIGIRAHACEWQLWDGDLVVRSGLHDMLPEAVKAVELQRYLWEHKLTEGQKETARENARYRASGSVAPWSLLMGAQA